MARHRASKDETRRTRALTGRRSVAGWPLAALAAVALIAIGWVTWNWVGGTLSREASAEAAACPDGATTVSVDVAPSIVNQLRSAATDYNATHPVVSDHCVSVQVSAVDPAAVFTGLTGTWDPAKLGQKPQAWLPDSSLWTNQLNAKDPASVGDVAQSVATSPVVLAMPADAAKAVQASGAVPWAKLGSLVGSGGGGWSQLGEPTWGQFSLDVPDPSTNTASALAVEAILDPPTPQGQTPITSDLLSSPAVKPGLTSLATSQPTPAPATTRDALVALGKAGGLSSAPFSAVPATEVELYDRNLGSDGAPSPANIVDEVRTSGPTACADFPFLPLAGDWVTSSQLAAAQNFRNYLESSGAQAKLTKGGLRTDTGTTYPAASPGMDWGAIAQAATPTDAAGFQQLTSAWTAAQPGN